MLPESPRFAKRTEKRFAQTITSRAAQHVISSSRTINPLHTAHTRCSYQQHRRMGSLIHCTSLRRDNAPFAITRIPTLANHQRSHSGKDAHPPRRITLRYTVICTRVHALNSTRDETHFPPPRAHALNSARVMHTVALVDTVPFADAVKSPAPVRP